MFDVITQIASPAPNTANLFSFATFISGLALLAIIYTISSVRYHFRIAITPFPIYKITFFLIAFIGVGTLLTDLFSAEGWYVPQLLNDPLLIQASLGAIFLLLLLTWMFFAFISPPIFNRLNYKKFTETLYVILAKGSDSELPVIADELGRSAESIIRLCKNIEADIPVKKTKRSKKRLGCHHYASDLVMMIGHRKLCRHMISSAPGTAIELFREMTRHNKYDIPIGQFSVNISTEALKNLDSSIYHEDEGYQSGLFGQVKPFSKAVYGNYKLVEELGSRRCSPLDLPYELTSQWNAEQLEAYCRCTLLSIENYLVISRHSHYTPSINRAIEIIKESCRDVTKINEEISGNSNPDIHKRLYEATRFAEKVGELLDKHWHDQMPAFKNTSGSSNIYDAIAKFMFDIIFYASHVTSPSDRCWAIQYVSVWNSFFVRFRNSKAMKIINYKLRRLLYDCLIEMNDFPNYKSARILGFCLNVMGLTPKKDTVIGECYSLHRMIIKWVIKNFHSLSIDYPDIANTCLQGNISYDKGSNQLVGTYLIGMKKELSKTTLQLESNV